jgi:hypothetical protein
LELLSQFDEYSDSLLRRVIDDPVDHPASQLLILMFKKKFRHVQGCPELFASLRSDFEEIKELIASSGLNRAAYIPVVRHGDCGNPRCVEFGGCIPHDPAAGYPLCPKCQVPVTHVATIYVGSLPDELQGWFPPDERDTVLVVGYCEQCFLDPPVFCHRKDEIDRLVFSSNFANAQAFNEPRVVERWIKKISLPDLSALEDVDMSSVIIQHGQSEIWEAVLGEAGGTVVHGTYAGGYPSYVQGSERPAPTCRLLLELCESEASTGMWGDAGTAQLWMDTGENYGFFSVTWSCS